MEKFSETKVIVLNHSWFVLETNDGRRFVRTSLMAIKELKKKIMKETDGK